MREVAFLLLLLFCCTVGLNFKKVIVRSPIWNFFKKEVATISLLHCSLQCENDRHLFGDDTSCQAFTIMRKPGFCTMGYQGPALPEGHGYTDVIEAWQERETACCKTVKVTAPPVRCTDYGGCPNSATKIIDLSGTYTNQGYWFGPTGRPIYFNSIGGNTFKILSNKRNNWVLALGSGCSGSVGGTGSSAQDCKDKYFSTTTKHRHEECPGDLGPVWESWSMNQSSITSTGTGSFTYTEIRKRDQQISVECV